MNSKLRIVMTVDPEIPVPPVHYGGIERIVDMLIRELQARGHEVHLFANPSSSIDTHLVPYKSLQSQALSSSIQNTLQLCRYVHQLGSVDIIHSFARLVYLLPLMVSKIPKIQSYQRAISPRSVQWGNLLAGRSMTFTSCSAANAAPVRDLAGKWATIHNGVETAKYDYVDKLTENAPLVFLGRVERIKGAHTAIEIARKTGSQLLIAGNHATSGDEADYFTHEILPQCDGERIIYLGPVDNVQKNTLLGRAAALLFPIEWEEPFGIVMVEALACGTPVIAFRRGSVPEVIDHGLTGFVCTTSEEMIMAVRRIREIDRVNCRRAVEERYSEKFITDQYEMLYYSAVTAVAKG